MKYLAIILVAVLAILIVVFISWFLNMKANGKCPLCALKKIFIPTKLTIDISEDEEYSEIRLLKLRLWAGQAGIPLETILTRILLCKLPTL